MQCAQPSCVQVHNYGVLALVSSLRRFAKRTMIEHNKYAMAVHLKSLAVQCLLTFYHGDTRVLGKAKKLVTKKFVLA